MIYKLITAATELAITLDEAKAQQNIDTSFTGDDSILTGCIHAAALHIEKIIQGPVMAQVWEAQSSDFFTVFELDKKPTSITTLKYFDISNAEQTVNSSNYEQDLASVPARVIMNTGYSLPSVYDRFDAVNIRFACGYANATAVPYDLKQWVKVLVTRFYQNRDYSVDVKTDELIKKNLMAFAAWL